MSRSYAIVNGIRVFRDITGNQYGTLTAICPEIATQRPSDTKWRCRCECGREVLVAESSLRSGHTDVCCNRVSDLSGKRFGHLVAIRALNERRYGQTVWLCQCDCGQAYKVVRNALLQDRIHSCGCDARAKSSERATTHGMTHTLEYATWRAMVNRCHNPNNAAYPRYGGRGIQVCPRWRESFEAFYVDMGKHPGHGYSIDRIDVNGDYELGNCRWANASTQMVNRRPYKARSGVVGVRKNSKGHRWRATMSYKGIKIVDETSDTFDGAVVARRAAETKVAELISRDTPVIRRKGGFPPSATDG